MQMLCARFIGLAIHNLQRNCRVKLSAWVLLRKAEVDRTNGEVCMLAACDVWKNIKHPTQTNPPRSVHTYLRRANKTIQKTSDRHERIRAICKTKSLTEQTSGNMQNHEYAHDE